MSNHEICCRAANGHIALCCFDNFAGVEHARRRAARFLRPHMTAVEICRAGALVGLPTWESPIIAVGQVPGASEN